MKKLITLLLAAALALSLAACGGGGSSNETGDSTSGGGGSTGGGGTSTKEELLENAQNTTISEIYSSISSNKVYAEETYKGNSYILLGRVETIESDYIEMSGDGYPNPYVKVYMSTDDIKNVKTNQWFEIVGEVTAIDLEDSSKDLGGGVQTQIRKGVELSSAYLINDTFEVSGILEIGSKPNLGMAWVIKLDSDSIKKVSGIGHEELVLSDIPVNTVGDSNIIDTMVDIAGIKVEENSSITLSGNLVSSNYLKNITVISDD